MRKILFIWLIAALVLALAFQPRIPVRALEVNDTDTVNISIRVANRTMIDVNPAALVWTGINPGGVGYPDDSGYFAIQIENIGSHNITHIWFNATYPTTRPFASGTNTVYDAGNFVVLAREPAGGATQTSCEGVTYYFPNRLEYNESRSLVYLKDPSGNMPPDTSSYSYGRFRNSSYEYFWMVSRGTNCVGQTFYIGNTPHTETQTGTTDFTGTDVTSFNLAASSSHPGWCYGNITAGHPLEGYTVYVKNETYDQVFFVHWNKDFEEGSTEYFFSGNLVPGNSTVACIQVWVPYGVYEGWVSQGTLTVLVNDL